MISKRIGYYLLMALTVMALLYSSCTDMGKEPPGPENHAPLISSPGAVIAFESVQFTYMATAHDHDEDVLSFTFENYPGWLATSGSTIFGTPIPGLPDTSFLIVVSDGRLADSLTVSVTIVDTSEVANRPPVISSPDTASATENQPFTYHVIAGDPDGTTPGILFDGYAGWLTPSGDSIYGTPQNGTPDTSFVVIASDGLAADTLIVSLTIINGPVLVSYNSQIQPVFDASCAVSGCHMGMTPPAGLRLMSYAHLMEGGQSGQVVIPYQPDSSILVQRIEGTITPRMPFNGPPYLPDSTIQMIRTWIAQGALEN